MVNGFFVLMSSIFTAGVPDTGGWNFRGTVSLTQLLSIVSLLRGRTPWQHHEFPLPHKCCTFVLNTSPVEGSTTVQVIEKTVTSLRNMQRSSGFTFPLISEAGTVRNSIKKEAQLRKTLSHRGPNFRVLRANMRLLRRKFYN